MALPESYAEQPQFYEQCSLRHWYTYKGIPSLRVPFSLGLAGKVFSTLFDEKTRPFLPLCGSDSGKESGKSEEAPVAQNVWVFKNGLQQFQKNLKF